MKYALSLMLLLLVQTPLYALSPSATTEREIAISRRMINDQRNTALALNMSFTEQEKVAFWPLYLKYRDAQNNVDSRLMHVIVDYADNYDNMTESKARELLDRALIYEEQAIKVKQLYVDKFRRILPNVKVARLMQIEGRMDTAIRLKLSEGVPLME